MYSKKLNHGHNVIWEIPFISEIPLWLEGTIRTVKYRGLVDDVIIAQHMMSFLQKHAKKMLLEL